MQLSLKYNRNWTPQHEFDSNGKFGDIVSRAISFNPFFHFSLEIAFIYLADEWITYPRE